MSKTVEAELVTRPEQVLRNDSLNQLVSLTKQEVDLPEHVARRVSKQYAPLIEEAATLAREQRAEENRLGADIPQLLVADANERLADKLEVLVEAFKQFGVTVTTSIALGRCACDLRPEDAEARRMTYRCRVSFHDKAENVGSEFEQEFKVPLELAKQILARDAAHRAADEAERAIVSLKAEEANARREAKDELQEFVGEQQILALPDGHRIADELDRIATKFVDRSAAKNDGTKRLAAAKRKRLAHA